MRNYLGWIAAAVLVLISLLYFAFDWTVNRVYVPEGKSLLLRYKGPLLFTSGNKYAAPGHFALDGEIGVKEKMPGPGGGPGNVQAGRRGTGRECGSLHEIWSRQTLKRFNATGISNLQAVQAT